MVAAFDSYSHPVQRADAARWMLLHAYGGLYLDTDVECLAPAAPSLEGAGLAFNCEAGKGGAGGERDGVGNAAVASAARHPFWLAVMREALRRANDSAYAQHANGFVRVLATTGPWMVSDVLRSHFGVGADAPLCGRRLEAPRHGSGGGGGGDGGGGGPAAVYPVGSWFTPCRPSDDACET